MRTREAAPEDGLCTIPTCCEIHYAKGRCKRHYYRNKRGVPDDAGRQHGEHKWNVLGERWCNYHQAYHEPSKFGDHSEIVDGLKGDCREACKWKGIFHRYGLTEQQWIDKYNSQNGLCAICKENEATHIDHDHKCCPGYKNQRKTCGKCVRDLLCRQCNVKLHALEEESWFEMAMMYVNRHGGKKA